jgi:hypothetical protein
MRIMWQRPIPQNKLKRKKMRKSSRSSTKVFMTGYGAANGRLKEVRENGATEVPNSGVIRMPSAPMMGEDLYLTGKVPLTTQCWVVSAQHKAQAQIDIPVQSVRIYLGTVKG